MSKKQTGGGRFDPTEGPVYFLAGHMGDELATHPYTLVAVNDFIEGENEARRTVAYRLSIPDHRLMIDSGIFWLTNMHMKAHPPMTMDEALSLAPDQIDGFAELWALYRDVVREYEPDLWGYIELDQGGADNKRKTRARLEAEGLRPIPVYHPLNDGWGYFDELCEEYDRICVGNVVQANRQTRKALLHTIWERRRRHPDVWIHLLGITPNVLTTAYPPSSCDSSSFAHGLKYGASMAPYAWTMGARAGRMSSGYSYLYADPVDAHGPGGYYHALEWVAAQATFVQRNWRNQQADLERVLAYPASPPPVLDGEPALR
jgi:hypothetical protein